MAKYTERYIDYVKGGGKIPASFALIQDFENLFLMKFANREIGFETEDAFALQLELRADLAIPVYKERIDRVKKILPSVEKPSKTISSKGTSETNGGLRKTTDTVLPFDVSTAKPSSISETAPITDSMASSNEQTQTGFTIDEAMRAVDFAKKSTGEMQIIGELLDEFNVLFMGVF